MQFIYQQAICARSNLQFNSCASQGFKSWGLGLLHALGYRVKLFGTIANLHGNAVASHLTKIVSNIIKRIKDPDSNVRDACPETMGILSAQYLSANSTVRDYGGKSGSGSAIALFTKPLLEAMNEQNKSIQNVAAACLAKVIENAKDLPLEAFEHLCPRICKYLSNPTFLGKAALLSVIASLAQVLWLSLMNM